MFTIVLYPLVFSQAGLASSDVPEQLLIALEPEAASVYCREKKIREFVSESEQDNATVSDVLVRPNIQYMVVDIGGVFQLMFCLGMLTWFCYSKYCFVCPLPLFLTLRITKYIAINYSIMGILKSAIIYGSQSLSNIG